MKITIIGSAREGGRAGFLTKALNTIGHEAVLVDSDIIADRFKGNEYLDIVNKGKPIFLDDITECDTADAVLIIHHSLRYTMRLHGGLRPLVAFWHCEPYFRPSITPDLLLAADTNVQGHWLQWWRWEYTRVTRTALFPFACPDLSWVKPSVIDSGLHFLANRSFNAPGMHSASYFDRHALRERNRIVHELSAHLTIHSYPIPWRQYIQELSECAHVLIVPGGGCQFNQQFSECLALNIKPNVFIEEIEQRVGYDRIGLVAGEHYDPFTCVDDIKWSDGDSSVRKWAAANSYTARARTLVAEIQKTREMIEDNERFAAAVK